MKKVIIAILVVVLGYMLITLAITLAGLLQMVATNNTCRGVELGEEAYNSALQNGGGEYSINDQPNVKLYHLPAQTSATTDFVIVLPGGGFTECETYKVAMPFAWQAVQNGYTAFVITYRFGNYTSKYGPLDDLAQAVRYILDNAQTFNVNTQNYAVVGFSAGGTLASLFGTQQFGYTHYNLPSPTALVLAYPWTNINAPSQITGNMWMDIVMAIGRSNANKCMFGKPTDDEKASLCVQNFVDESYPATYIITGDSDQIVNYQLNAQTFAAALQQHGVRNKLVVASGLNHGFGLGLGTTAEGWAVEALQFAFSSAN